MGVEGGDRPETWGQAAARKGAFLAATASLCGRAAPAAQSAPHCVLQTGREERMLQGPPFQGSRDQGKHLRPLQTGKKTDPQAESSRKQSWKKHTQLFVEKPLGSAIWLNVPQGQGAHSLLGRTGALLNALLPGCRKGLLVEEVPRSTGRRRAGCPARLDSRPDCPCRCASLPQRQNLSASVSTSCEMEIVTSLTGRYQDQMRQCR